MDIQRLIVTGINRGLGKDLLRLILQNNPQYQVIGTVRSEPKQIQQKLLQMHPQRNVRILQLNLFSTESIDKFVGEIKDSNFYFDCLINNGAYGCDYGQHVPSVDTAQKTLITNFIGTTDLTHKILHFLKPKGRIINVSSKLGGLYMQGKQVRQKYINQNIEYEWIRKQVYEYIQGCKNNDVGIYSKSAYSTSKMMLNTWSRFILKKKLKQGQTTIAMSPGHCKTDMGKEHALRTSLQGAQSIYSLIKGEYSPDVFYHVSHVSDFINCG